MRRRRRKNLGEASPACPITTITREEHRDHKGTIFAVDFELKAGKKVIGTMMVEVGDDGHYAVGATAIHEYEQRRCGLGTKLYEAAATWGCERGLQLESDELRSIDSHSFWRKQERKGRAACTGPARHPLRNPTSPGPQFGRDDCKSYKLTSCAVPMDLKGKRRRGR